LKIIRHILIGVGYFRHIYGTILLLNKTLEECLRLKKRALNIGMNHKKNSVEIKPFAITWISKLPLSRAISP